MQGDPAYLRILPGFRLWEIESNTGRYEPPRKPAFPSVLSALDPLMIISRPWLSPQAVGMLGGPLHHPIGVRTFRNTQGGVVRVFYPGEEKKGSEQAKIFKDPLSRIVEGYLHVFAGGFWGARMRKGGILFEILSLMVRVVVFLLPLSRAPIPKTYESLPLKASVDAQTAPLVMWSHGLTGTSDEHSLLAASLAADGNVVALVHHTDGSSARAEYYNEKEEAGAVSQALYYQHPPPAKDYDPLYRPKQIKRRAEEIEDARRLLLGGACGKDLASCIDTSRTVIGGFSFGAATASYIAATRKGVYKCCVLWDGWFHIEIGGHRVDMPAEAHENGLDIPALFVGSEQFEGFTNLADATKRLQAKCRDAEVHVPKNTKHQNFADVVWWINEKTLKKMGMIGSADAIGAYCDIVQITRDFVLKHSKARVGAGR